MKKIIKLNEKDLSRIVKRVIKENEGRSGLTQAMRFLDNFLEEMGGTLGSRTPEDIMSDLEHLERAIKIEKNNLGVAMERPNPRWGMNESAQKKQMFQQKAESCFDSKKYPQIAALMKAYSLSIFAVAGVALTILSSGIAAGLGITGAIFGAGAAYEQVEKAINNPKSTFKKEITTFLKCTGVM